MTDPASPAQEGGPLHKRDYNATASGPLSGVRVLDLSRLFAGNVLTQMLGDFGAEVIKVEPPTGDTLRDWKTAGVSTHWKIYARNKKSLALDLRNPKAIGIIRSLVPSASILIESFRPGVLEEMGLSPDSLHAISPKLVIIRISGWGQDGPYHRRPGFGTIIEGMSGFAAMNGFEDREPVLPPTYLADGVAGLYGASAAMIALHAANAPGGGGQTIDLPLLDPLVALLGPHAANFRLTGRVPRRTGSRSNNSAPRNAYRCSDGRYVSVSGSIQTMTERLFRTIGRPELIDDPRFRTNGDRLRNVEELDAIVGGFMARHTQAEVIAIMQAADVTVGPIYDVSQLLEDEHVVQREILADYPDADLGQLPMHHVSPRLMGTPGSIRTPAPALGQHNREILAELGVDERAYEVMLAEGLAVEGKP